MNEGDFQEETRKRKERGEPILHFLFKKKKKRKWKKKNRKNIKPQKKQKNKKKPTILHQTREREKQKDPPAGPVF